MNPVEYGNELAAGLTAEIRARAKAQRVSLRALARRIGMPYPTMQRRVRLHGWKYGELAVISHVLGFELRGMIRQVESALDGQEAPMT